MQGSNTIPPPASRCGEKKSLFVRFGGRGGTGCIPPQRTSAGKNRGRRDWFVRGNGTQEGQEGACFPFGGSNVEESKVGAFLGVLRGAGWGIYAWGVTA